MPNNSTMTDAAVMNVLFMKFQDLCRSGKDAHLSFECHAKTPGKCKIYGLPIDRSVTLRTGPLDYQTGQDN